MSEAIDTPSRPRFGWPELLLLIATASAIAIPLFAHHFPYIDPTNHLARYALIARIWFGSPPGYVIFRWVPTAYIAGDVMGALLVHFAGAITTLRLIDIACLTLLPLGMYTLLLRTAPTQRGWALVGTLMGFTSPFMFGNLNFQIGIGLFFFWLAFWYPQRESTRWGVRAALALGAMALFLVHLTAPLLVLVVIWTDYGITAVGGAAAAETNGIPAPWKWRLNNSHLAVSAIVTCAIALIWFGASHAIGNETGPPGEYEFRSITNKLVALVSPFYSVSVFAAAVMTAGYAASLAAMLFVRRHTLRLETFTASAAMLFVVYLLFPKSIPGSIAVDLRWLIAAYPLVFCGSAPIREKEPRLVLLIPFAACLLSTAITGLTARTIDRDLDQYAAALAHVPAGTTLLPVGDGVKKWGRTQARGQFELWHVINAKGRAPGLFNYYDFTYQSPLNTHLAHFVEPEHLYLAESEWGDPEHPPVLPWLAIDSEYDYIMQSAGGVAGQVYLRRHADEVWHDDTYTLYKVRKQ